MFLKKIFKLIKILKSRNFIRGLLKGVAAGTEHLSVLANLNIELIVDIGANRGQFALAAREMFPGSCIHSFEPLDEAARKFREVFSSDPNVHLHQYAIGPSREVKTIHVSKRDDSSSLLPISATQSELFPHTGENETRQTQVLPLNEIIDVSEITQKSILKIDVQGFELDALRGCSTELGHFSYVYVECSFVELYEGQAFAGEVIDFLHLKRFSLIGVYNMFYDSDGKAIQADFLFENSRLVK